MQPRLPDEQGIGLNRAVREIVDRKVQELVRNIGSMIGMQYQGNLGGTSFSNVVPTGSSVSAAGEAQAQFVLDTSPMDGNATFAPENIYVR